MNWNDKSDKEVNTLNIELMGYIELNAISKSETRNKNDEYWSMQLSNRRKGCKKNFRSGIRRRNG